MVLLSASESAQETKTIKNTKVWQAWFVFASAKMARSAGSNQCPYQSKTSGLCPRLCRCAWGVHPGNSSCRTKSVRQRRANKPAYL